VVSVVNDVSLHRNWNTPNANFDVMLIYTGPEKGKFEKDCKYYFADRGPKWKLHKKYATPYADNYPYLFFIDPDISMTTAQINKMFEFAENWELNMAQPSLSPEVKSNVNITLNNPKFSIRFTNFVELEATIFSSSAFKSLNILFDQVRNSMGYEWILPKYLEHDRCAIVDEVIIKRGGKCRARMVENKPEREANIMAHGMLASCVEIDAIPRYEIDCDLNPKELLAPYQFANLARPNRRANNCSNAEVSVGARLLHYRR
jgi:hypothetical protein